MSDDRMVAYETTFAVRGVWPFPHDMLRFDECWPVDDAGAHLIDDMQPSGNPVTITLRTRAPNPQIRPTARRWESFGWKVVETP